MTLVKIRNAICSLATADCMNKWELLRATAAVKREKSKLFYLKHTHTEDLGSEY